MANDLDPVVDNWYFHHDKGQDFKVLDVDSERGVVEIQHFDGDLEELTMDEWRNLDIELSEEPPNWSGPLDVGNLDDLGEDITDTAPEDWEEPMESFKSVDEEKLTPD